MIKLNLLQSLDLAAPLGLAPHAHLSAASGLVKIGQWLFIVADDEKHLVVFNCASDTPGTPHRIMEGELPLEAEARKAGKHDFEAITLLPSSEEFPSGALLILGSGSKKQREQGVILPFLEPPNNNRPPRFAKGQIIDLDPIFDALKDEPGKANIEGALIVGKEILLFQRGNKNNHNAIIRFKWRAFFAAVTGAQNDTPKYSIKHYELGDIKGVPLCFTDATCLDDGRILCTAAAENTDDAYIDGACLGSAISCINADGELVGITQVDKLVKLEGIEAEVEQTKIQLYLVSDPDNAQLAGQLFTARINLDWN